MWFLALKTPRPKSSSPKQAHEGGQGEKNQSETSFPGKWHVDYPKWFYLLLIAILERECGGNDSSSFSDNGKDIMGLLQKNCRNTKNHEGNSKSDPKNESKSQDANETKCFEPVIRVRICEYFFSNTFGENKIVPIWTTRMLLESIPPSNLQDLYLLLEDLEEGTAMAGSSGRRPPSSLTVESAQEIIMRTMFEKLKKKEKKKTSDAGIDGEERKSYIPEGIDKKEE
jgi:hypothetical protein